MSFRDLWRYVQYRERRWRHRSKMGALWTAGAAVGVDLFAEDPDFGHPVDGDDA